MKLKPNTYWEEKALHNDVIFTRLVKMTFQILDDKEDALIALCKNWQAEIDALDKDALSFEQIATLMNKYLVQYAEVMKEDSDDYNELLRQHLKATNEAPEDGIAEGDDHPIAPQSRWERQVWIDQQTIKHLIMITAHRQDVSIGGTIVLGMTAAEFSSRNRQTDKEWIPSDEDSLH
jgi:hypothetical protein